MTDPIKRLRDLLAKAKPKKWAGIMAFIVEAENGAHGTVCSFVNCDGDTHANQRLVIATVNALPALLDALELYRHVAESARDQWGDDHLWEKWGHDKDMAAAAEAMAKLEAIK